jgi:hypothetical protein
LLPRAELRAAVAKGSVESIDAFIREHPKTGIEQEVETARRTALVTEFERVRKLGTVSALLSFAGRFPNHGIGPVFDQVRRAFYARALERYKSEIPAGSTELPGFAGRLVAFAERAGPRSTPDGFVGPAVKVRFRRIPSRDMERADEAVRKSPMFNGASSLPSRYLDAPRLEPHEQGAARAIATGLSRAFDAEIVTFEPGPPVEGGTDDLPPLAEPTVVVSYRVESSGAAFAGKRPRGIFMGLVFYCKTDFVLPGDTRPLRSSFNITERIPTDLLKDFASGVPALGSVETAVYEAMTREAFKDIGERYLATWFKKRESAPAATP